MYDFSKGGTLFGIYFTSTALRELRYHFKKAPECALAIRNDLRIVHACVGDDFAGQLARLSRLSRLRSSKWELVLSGVAGGCLKDRLKGHRSLLRSP
jgi:hypothetical protein